MDSPTGTAEITEQPKGMNGTTGTAEVDKFITVTMDEAKVVAVVKKEVVVVCQKCGCLP